MSILRVLLDELLNLYREGDRNVAYEAVTWQRATYATAVSDGRRQRSWKLSQAHDGRRKRGMGRAPQASQGEGSIARQDEEENQARRDRHVETEGEGLGQTKNHNGSRI